MAPPAIYALSLHDALPISAAGEVTQGTHTVNRDGERGHRADRLGNTRPAKLGLDGPAAREDRKSTRLNSSHRCVSYAVFCLKKKKTQNLRRQSTTRNDTTH